MQIQKNRRPKSTKIIATVGALVLLVGAGVFYFLSQRGDNHQPEQLADASTHATSTNSTKKPQKESSAADPAKQKQAFLDSNAAEDGSTISQTNSGNDIQMAISQSDGKVIVSTNLGYVSQGTCRLTVGSVTHTASVMFQPDYSTCMGFSIDRSQLATGRNTFRLEVSYDDVVLTKTETADIK
jgi:hypothetical protein